MNKKAYIIGGVLLAALLVGGYFYNNTQSQDRVPSEGERASSKTGSNEVFSGEVTVEMTEDGFVPEELTIKKGTTVHFVNKDELWHWPASDIHPSHGIYPEFDSKEAVAPGDTWSFTFDQVGEWGMHDHISPYITGKITVVE